MDEYEVIKVSELDELEGDLSAFQVFGFKGNVSGRVPMANLVGPQGENIELQKTATHIQWRVVGTATWIDLVALADIQGSKGDAGPSIELQRSNDYIQWRVSGTEDWNNLVATSDLKGDKGDPGKDFIIKGYYDTLSALELAVTSPSAGDAYGVGSSAPYDIYVYDSVGSAWVNNGAIQGAAGTSAYVYIAYASDNQGSNFSASEGEYIAILTTDTVIANPQASDFTGLWKPFKVTSTLNVAFIEAETKANIATGESLSTLFGKLKKWYSSFGALAWKSAVDYSTDEITNKPTIPTVTNDFTNDYKGYIDFLTGFNTVTTLASVPITKRSVKASISTDSTLSLTGTLAQGREMQIKVYNSGATELTITLPNTTPYESVDKEGTAITSVTLPASANVEISIWAVNSKYIIKTDA